MKTRKKFLPFWKLAPVLEKYLDRAISISSNLFTVWDSNLEPFSDKLVPEILEILKTNDGVWKYWILTTLARKTKDERLLKEIERIAKHPTKDEIEEEVNLEAIAILNGDYI
ncbi:DUF5071 domain-containing protein [Chitinophaga sp. Hz27]|uniref:DUF5071 domain-containing protein n=1 Tax=Chitinophaga sp. Hz27 TaxID=3347169 RepID=UPI0035DBF6BD